MAPGDSSLPSATRSTARKPEASTPKSHWTLMRCGRNSERCKINLQVEPYLQDLRATTLAGLDLQRRQRCLGGNTDSNCGLIKGQLKAAFDGPAFELPLQIPENVCQIKERCGSRQTSTENRRLQDRVLHPRDFCGDSRAAPPRLIAPVTAQVACCTVMRLRRGHLQSHDAGIGGRDELKRLPIAECAVASAALTCTPKLSEPVRIDGRLRRDMQPPCAARQWRHHRLLDEGGDALGHDKCRRRFKGIGGSP